MTDSTKKLEELFKVVQTTSDIRARSELYKFYMNCKHVVIAINKEEVECRRLKRVTPKYTDLQKELEESVKVFEHWVFLAKLMY
jgi:hypothetical protein